MVFFLPIIYSFILGVVHFFNEKIQVRQEYVRIRVISFIAGISVTYMFLILLPEVYDGFEIFDRVIFISLLAGFTISHITEKYIYQHSAPHSLKESLSGVHSLAFFIYYFFIGVILVRLNQINTLNAVLFFLPVMFYSAVGILSLERIHAKIWEKPSVKLLLSASSLVGVLFADFILQFSTLFDLLFAFVIGTFLYTALMDFVPREAKGRPEYFTLGVLIYTLVIVAAFL